MNDYKELIDGLQRLGFFNQRAGRELWADKPHDVQERDIESAHNILLSAIETIEQLVKERDAAVKWIPRQCDTCRHYKHDERETSCMKFGCENWKFKENWKWRGVQDE